jgi:hypothetical protein
MKKIQKLWVLEKSRKNKEEAETGRERKRLASMLNKEKKEQEKGNI